MRDGNKATIERWLADGDTWVGVFENRDLGHRDFGARCAFPFALSDGSFERAEIGRVHAPDGRMIGLGWRYVLVAKCRDVESALEALEGKK